MSEKMPAPLRFIGLDVHKYYLIAAGVDATLQQVLGPQRVPLVQLDDWARKHLTRQDAVVLEMTTNAFQLYDDLQPSVHSVTLIHPPHVPLITHAQVMTDKIAAFTLARLHAAGLLSPVWVPPPAVRDHRALVAQRSKMVRLGTQAKNRLHAVLHRHHLPVAPGDAFSPERQAWWLALPISPLERVRLRSDLDTLVFAQAQVAQLEKALAEIAAQDERVALLVQLPGLSLISAMTLLAAIGDVARFPSAAHLVGYAGMGAAVHDSGLTRRTGAVTKAGRRDIRTTMVEAAHTASRIHPHWRDELARLEPRLGHNKAIMAIARKMLVGVWHVLTHQTADRFSDPTRLARKLLAFAYRLGQANRQGETAAAYVRRQLDLLGVGAELTEIPWGNRPAIPLPPSRPNPTKPQP